MSLPDFSLRRPITVIMVFIGVILLGFISWSRLPQELFPPITYPQLTVVTTYKDAAPEEIEILVTKPLEETIGTVSGLKRISSASKEETSIITAEFNWGTNMDFAALGVREKIDLVKERLPRGSEEPVVMKYNPFDLPVMVLNITSDLPPAEAMQFVRKVIKNELEKTDGVAVVQLSGGREREILVEVDQGRLQAAGISVVALSEALNKANLNYPAGTIEESFYEYLIRTIGEFKAVNEIRDVPVVVDEIPVNPREENPQEQGIRPPKDKKTEKRLILIKDVAVVKDTLRERSSISRYNGKDNISISVIKQAGANTIWVANNVRETIGELKASMPAHVKLNIAYDQSKFIKGAVGGVRDAAVQGGFLAFIVLYMFLRRFSSSLIVTASIPISILGVFSLMYFSNISLNMISLGGLALGVGMLVDNAIVVMENISRYKEAGKNPKDASVAGAKEVGSAITGSTLTTVAVFLPMVFVIGVAGQLFKELAFTVVASLMVSLIVALTLIPIMVSKEALNKSKNNILPVSFKKYLALTETFFVKLSLSVKESVLFIKLKEALSLENAKRVVSSSLRFFLKHRIICLLLVFLVFFISIFFLINMDWELLPRVDQGQFIIKVDLPPGTRLEVTDSVVKKIEKELFSLPEVSDITVTIGSSREKISEGPMIETLGSNQSQIMVLLKSLAAYKKTKYPLLQFLIEPFSVKDPKKVRTRSTGEVLQSLKSSLEKDNLFGADVQYILQESVFQNAFSNAAPVVIEIKGHDLLKIKAISDDVEKNLEKIKGVYSVRSSFIKPAPEAKVYVKKDRAAAYNLSVSDIALTSQTAMKGYVATKYKEAGREIDVRVRLRPKDRSDINKIRRLLVHSPLDIDVPLAEVAYMKIGKGPSQIQRLAQQRVIMVSAGIYKRPYKEVVEDINIFLARMKLSLPPDYSAKLTGENLQMKESFDSLRFALILSLFLVYMIMAAEFESLWQPFIILFTFPLSLIGVCFGLWVTNTAISIMVLLGIIILGGIVVNNGIVLVEYVNLLRGRDNFNLHDALIEASQMRLRPILMTALTTVLGLLPLAIGLAEGAEIQIPMAVTVMSGLTISTFLSLIVIPLLYLSFEKSLAAAMGLFFGAPQQVRLEFEPEYKPKPKPEYKTSTIIHLPYRREPSPQISAINLPHQEEAPSERDESRIFFKDVLPDKYKSIELTDRQKELILYLIQNDRITRPEYIIKFNVSVATAARDIKDMLDRGLIKTCGPQAVGRYYELA